MILADCRCLAKPSAPRYRDRSPATMRATLPCARGKRPPTRDRSRREPWIPRGQRGTNTEHAIPAGADASPANRAPNDNPSAAGDVVIPDSAWGALPQHPGPNRLLLLLWQFSGWKPGATEPPFAWPSIDTLAERLNVRPRTVRELMAKLRELGYVRAAVEHRIANGRRDEREGWRVFEDPTAAAAFDAEIAAAAQLDLFAGSAHVDNLCTDEPAATDDAAQVRTDPAQVRHRPCAGAPEIGAGAPPSKEGASLELSDELVVSVGPPPDDDDAQRIWLGYEADRVRLLGGTARGGSAPPLLRALIRSHGLAAVETYATRSLALARDAVDRARQCAPALVAARADGREWTIPRLEAVAAFPDPVGPVTRAPPPPEPTAAGERVTLHEREAFDRGGEAAVIEQRRELAERPTAGVAHIDDWLRRMGGGA